MRHMNLIQRALDSSDRVLQNGEISSGNTSEISTKSNRKLTETQQKQHFVVLEVNERFNV